MTADSIITKIHNLNRDEDTDLFPEVQCGRYTISVQGGRGHFCNPKRDLPTLGGYDTVEVAVFDADGDLVFHYAEGDEILSYQTWAQVRNLTSSLLASA